MKSFAEKLSQGQIPNKIPKWFQRQEKFDNPVKNIVQLSYRDLIINNHGMWVLVDLQWTEQLAAWIQKNKVLEIMAGQGWLAQALNHHGVEITATDDYSWDSAKNKKVFDVKQYDAVEAVRSLGNNHDILLVSWSPYNDETICRASEEWGSDRPIIYIGEGEGGANAPQAFFKNFTPLLDTLSIEIPRWWFVRDRLMIGRYGNF